VVGSDRHNLALEALRDRLLASDSAGRVRLVNETGPGAAARLTMVVPLFQAPQIEDECFRTALWTWSGPVVAGIRICKCGEELQKGNLRNWHLGIVAAQVASAMITHHSIRDTMFRTSCGRQGIACAESRMG
jgi:hypothetical protein